VTACRPHHTAIRRLCPREQGLGPGVDCLWSFLPPRVVRAAAWTHL